MLPKPVESQPTPSHDDATRLTSWKEIAAFLQVSIKTAQRYEAERGLPVNRIGARVSVTAADLTAWQRASAAAKPWWQQTTTLQRIALTQAALLLLGIGYLAIRFWRALPGQVRSAEWQGQTLVAKDGAGREAWRHTFAGPHRVEIGSLAPIHPRVVDMDGDGTTEVLAVYHHARRDEEGWDLSCLNAGGGLKWRIGENEGISGPSRAFAPPYVIRAFVPFDSPEGDGTKWIAATFAHHHEFPSVLIVADSTGKMRGKFWHAGHLNDVVAADVTGDGAEELIAGGVQHGIDRATLIVFDPRRVSGATALPQGHSMAFRGRQPGSQIRTIYLQRTKLNEKTNSFNFVSRLSIGIDAIHAEVYEYLQRPEAYLLYKLSRDLKVLDVSPSVSFSDALRIEMARSSIFFTTANEVDRLKREVLAIEGNNDLSAARPQ